MNDWDLD